MSKWTGKCDFADHCEMIYDTKSIVKNATIFLGNAKVEIKDEKSLIPYYTNLISAMGSENGSQVIHLSENSYIDIEEKYSLSWMVYSAFKSARKAKKDKKPFTFDSLNKNDVEFNKDYLIVWKKLVDKINGNPDIIKTYIPSDHREGRYIIERNIIPMYFNDVHLSSYNRKREEFVEFAKENGYAVIDWTKSIPENIPNEGEYHPIIFKMCNDINNFYIMQRNYGE